MYSPTYTVPNVTDRQTDRRTDDLGHYASRCKNCITWWFTVDHKHAFGDKHSLILVLRFYFYVQPSRCAWGIKSSGFDGHKYVFSNRKRRRIDNGEGEFEDDRQLMEMVAETGNAYIYKTMRDEIEISAANPGFSTIAVLMKRKQVIATTIDNRK